ncbi:hypothetical protein BU15DRAFT_69340, partial [Melanogaster broomeanus]
MKFEQGDEGQSPGYKKAGSGAIDASGQPDAIEFITVAKDDALAFPRVALRTYPAPTTAAIPTAVPHSSARPSFNYTVLRIFNEKLGLPEGTMDRFHDLEEYSGSEARVLRSPPLPGKQSRIGRHWEHTPTLDRLVQCNASRYTEWSYVKAPAWSCCLHNRRCLAIFREGSFGERPPRRPPPGIKGDTNAGRSSSSRVL